MDDVKKSDVDLILKKLESIEKKVDRFEKYYEDKEFEQRTLNTVKEIEEGYGVEKEFDEAIEDMKKW